MPTTRLADLPAQFRALANEEQNERTFTGDARAVSFLKCADLLESALRAQAAEWREEASVSEWTYEYMTFEKCADAIDPDKERKP